MTPRYISLLLLTLALVGAGCGRKEPASDSDKKTEKPEAHVVEAKSIADYIPSSEGAEWEFYNGINEEPTATKRSVQRVSRSPQPPRVVRYETEILGTGTSAFEVYKYDDKTLYLVTFGDTEIGTRQVEPPKPMLRFPAKQDETWDWQGVGPTALGVMKHTSKFYVDTGITLDILAGRFRNVVVVTEEQRIAEGQFKGARIRTVTCYAPGCGAVKTAHTAYNPRGAALRIVGELKNCTLLQKAGQKPSK